MKPRKAEANRFGLSCVRIKDYSEIVFSSHPHPTYLHTHAQPPIHTHTTRQKQLHTHTNNHSPENSSKMFDKSSSYWIWSKMFFQNYFFFSKNAKVRLGWVFPRPSISTPLSILCGFSVHLGSLVLHRYSLNYLSFSRMHKHTHTHTHFYTRIHSRIFSFLLKKRVKGKKIFLCQRECARLWKRLGEFYFCVWKRGR